MKSPSLSPSLSLSSLRLALALVLLVPAFGSCRTVEFYELEGMSDPIMTIEAPGTELHFHQKVYYSMEGSAGGLGSSAGGGCGCY